MAWLKSMLVSIWGQVSIETGKDERAVVYVFAWFGDRDHG